MIFKNNKRAILTELGLVFVTALISALFFTNVLQFEKHDIGITVIILCFYGITVCTWFEEWHIQEEFFLTKCFYFEKKIKLNEIKYVLYKKSMIRLYDEQNNIIHTLFNDGSEKYQQTLYKLREMDVPFKTHKFSI